MVRLSCPSCNTAFALPELPADRRATCPRCDDAFPIRAWEDVGPEAAADPLPAAVQTPAPRRSLTPVVVPLLVLAFLTAGVWIYFNRDRKPMPEPTRLAGLGYLPADTNLAFGVRLAPVLDHASRTKQEPRDLIVKAGIPAQALDAINRLGVGLEQIDHIAGGTSLGDQEFELRLTLVLVLRAPLADPDEFLDKVQAKRRPGGKDRYGVELRGLPPAVLTFVSPTVLVLGLDEKKDFEAVERGGYGPDGKQFPPGLAAMIAEQVPSDAAVWAGTDDGQWADKPAVRLLANFALKRPEWLPVLARGRAGMAAVSFGDEPRLRLFVKAADAETGQKLRDYFREQAGTGGKARHGGAGETAFYDAPVDPADAFATLERFLRDAAKK